MVMISTGLGFLVPLIWVALALLASKIGLRGYAPKPFDACIVLLISSLSYCLVGVFLKSKRAVNNPSESYSPKTSHTFFFIKIKYWSVISLIIISVILIDHYYL